MTRLLLPILLYSFSCTEPIVYIFSGQSNTLGAGRTVELDSSYKREYRNIYYRTGNTFVKFHPGKTPTASSTDRFGPEVGFAAALEDSGSDDEIYLIKYAKGGKALHSGWDNQKWMGDNTGPDRENFHPGTNSSDPHMGIYYRILADTALKALTHLETTCNFYFIKGVFWMQGEQDAKRSTSATSYAQNLKLLITRMRDDLFYDRPG